ncbi:MAG: BLUF domain-containing protein [Phycisphaerales bacterium]
MRICHLLYASRATRALNDEEIAEIRVSRSEWFTKLGISGVMLVGTQHMMELLEGDPHHVDFAMNDIERAPYHADVFRILAGVVPKRVFPDWKVGRVPPGACDHRDLYEDAACLMDFMDLLPGIHTEKRSIAMLRYFRKRAMNSTPKATDERVGLLTALDSAA